MMLMEASSGMMINDHIPKAVKFTKHFHCHYLIISIL